MATAPPSSPAPLARDLHCIGCQYNLRTLLPTARCPECDRPVSDSLAHHRTHIFTLQHPRLLRFAAYCFAFLCFLALPVHLLFVWLNQPEIPIERRLLLEILTHFAFVAALSLGILLLNVSIGRSVLHFAIRGLLSLVAIAYAGMGLLTSLSMLALLFAPRRGRGAAMRVPLAEFLLREQRIITAGILLILALVAYFVMRRLANSLAAVTLERASRLAFCALAVCASFSLTVYFIIGAYRGGRGGRDFSAPFTALDACTAGIAVFIGCYWVYAARVIRDAAKKQAQRELEIIAASSRIAPPPEEKVAQFLANRSA